MYQLDKCHVGRGCCKNKEVNIYICVCVYTYSIYNAERFCLPPVNTKIEKFRHDISGSP